MSAHGRSAAQAFLRALIDHAGLFPPARLDMDAALVADAEARGGPWAALVGRFLCPASRLDELAAALERAPGDRPLPVSVVLDGADWASDLARVRAHDGSAALRVELVEGKEERRGAITEVGNGIGAFAEIPWSADWSTALKELPTGFGAKLRCGGEDAALFPPVEAVAAAITACRDAEVPLKATAGLHRAVRHHDPEDGFTHHGFLNVAGAGVLAHARGLGAEDLVAVVAEEDPEAFALDGERFRWHDLEVAAADVAAAREGLFSAYGSCSLTEPVEDLEALGVRL